MRQKLKLSLIAGGLLVFSVVSAQAQSSAGYVLAWHTLATGGGRAASATYTLDATVGQPVTGPSAGADREVWAGFWVEFETVVRQYLPLLRR